MLPLNWTTRRQKVLPIGLDIGHSSIKMVQLGLADEGLRVVAAERSLIGHRPAAHDRQQVIDAIKEMLAQGDFKGRNVVSALPAEELKITSLRLGEADALQVDKVLRKEAAQRFGLDPRTDVIHHMRAGTVQQGDEVKDEFILFATDNDTIKDHIALLEDSGLKPTGIDAAPCALFRNFDRTMRRQEDRERTTVFIDIGHCYTTVIFGRASEMCFVKQLRFGVARFAEDIAANLDLSVADADALRVKMQNGDSVDAATGRLIVDTLAATADALAGELSLCLRYYSVTFRGKRVERAVVAGGGARETALLDVIRQHLAIKTELAEPLRGFDLMNLGTDREGGDLTTDFALAIGLSLKGLDSPSVVAETLDHPPMSALEGSLS